MDPLPFVRNHMISYIFELLRDKPEQEQLLLRLLVNKLVFHLLEIINIRVTDPRKLLRRRHISYYSSNQLILR
jgi:hypothetical protein